MPDAWELLQSKSSGTGDAWDLLTNITGGVVVPGAAVNEISFRLEVKEITYRPTPITVKPIIDILDTSYNTNIGSITILED